MEVANLPQPHLHPRRQPPADAIRCTAITTLGDRCRHKKKGDGELCARHSESILENELRCLANCNNGNRCRSKHLEGDIYCKMHRRVVNFRAIFKRQREQRSITEAAIKRAINNHTLGQEHRDATVAFNRARQFDDFNATDDIRRRIQDLRYSMSRLGNRIINRIEGRPKETYPDDPDEAAAAADRVVAEALEWVTTHRDPRELEMGRFAHDNQNVHTRETNSMVQSMNDLLKDIEPIRYSYNEILNKFKDAPQMFDVLHDIRRFYVMPSCITDDDFLYRNTLDKVWGFVQRSKYREEMEKRLMEEATDSVGMCMQGHLTRLMNSLFGFEDSLQMDMSSYGEKLQDAMAKIRELDVGERERAARAVFDQLKVPDDDQKAWLDALAED